MLAWIGEKPCHLTAKCLKLSESIEDVAVQIMSEEQSFQRLAVLFHLLVMLIGNPKILMQLHQHNLDSISYRHENLL